MTTRTTITSGDRAATASPALLPLLLGCCPLGTVGRTYAFDPGDDVAGTLGGGILADAAYYMLRETQGRVRVTPATPTWSAAPAIAHTGTGPTVTCALTAGSPGCLDDHTILIAITGAGPLGTATADISYDGTTVNDSIVLPVEPAPSLLGTIDLTVITLSTLTATTLVLTAPAALTVTFTLPPTVEDIATQINAAAVLASTVHRAEISQDAAGTKKLRLYTTTGGAGVTLTIDAPTSTGEALLGFTSGATNLTGTGSAAKVTLPFTGLTYTFPAGAYTVVDRYLTTCVGPRASILALTTAATAAHDDFVNSPFGFMCVAQPSSTASNCAALEAAFNTLVVGWRADPNAAIFVSYVVGTPFHVASAVKATNDAAIATADAALLSAFASSSAGLNNVAGEDVYIPGATSLRLGSFRRTAALAWAVKRAAAAKLAADVGDGLVPEATLQAPDGATRARNEATASTKLGGGAGPGYSMLKSTSAGLGAVKFVPGATRAGGSSRLRFAGVVGVANEIARIVGGEVEGWEANTIVTDPQTKRIEDGEKASREDHLTGVLKPLLRPDDGVPNVSAFTVKIDNSGPFLDTGLVPTGISFVPLGEIEQVTVAISAVGTVTITG
jgi:hypothetical protein